jgi:micrococcal nuclease
VRTLALVGVALLLGVGVWLLLDREEDEAELAGRQGLVTHVADGDTLRARIGGSTERVRLIGVDAPERRECYFARSAELLRELTLDTVVRILGDSTQRERDRFGRLLAYVILPDGIDAGEVLLQRGAAVVFETRPPFARRDAYVEAQSDAAGAALGLHTICR